MHTRLFSLPCRALQPEAHQECCFLKGNQLCKRMSGLVRAKELVAHRMDLLQDLVDVDLHQSEDAHLKLKTHGS